MSKNDELLNGVWGIVGLAVLLFLIVAAAIAGIILLPFIAAAVFIVGGIYAYYHSPRYLERKAQEHTQLLYAEAQKLSPPTHREFLAQVIEMLGRDEVVANVASDLFVLEGFYEVPPPPPIANSIDGARYRDRINTFIAKSYDIGEYMRFERAVIEVLAPFARPPMEAGLFEVSIPLTIDDLQSLCESFFRYDDLFLKVRKKLQANADEQKVLPDGYKGDNAVFDYLKGTPLIDLSDRKERISLGNRFEHMHIVAGTGHGKTQTLQYLIANDLQADCSVVVIDSKGTLVDRIAHLDIDTDRLVLIDPTDIEYPVALNLFDIGQKRLGDYSALDRERLVNGIIELYDFVLGSLLGAEMTQKQAVIFRYITRLMLHIPDATIHTLVDLMRKGASQRYAEHINKLTGTARVFFEEEFDSREFEQTKAQVLRRLYGILENQSFERMFSHPRNRVDLFEAMNEGKVILINTAKSLLKENGTQIFGRFFIALITQAAQERATLRNKKPTYVYIDEAQDYFDANIDIILSQAREQNVGLILAHQYLGQLPVTVAQSLASNTSAKLAGGVSPADAKAMAPQLRTTQEFVAAQKTGRFAAYLKGITESAVSLTIPLGFMERLPKTPDFEKVRDEMRRRYSAPRQVTHQPAPEPDTANEQAAVSDIDNIDTDASSTL